jgi:hypothetical protein
MLLRQKVIKREDLWNNPTVFYLFGDNFIQKGMGGQAKEMRGEPNAIGIPTKHKPTNEEDAFFSDMYYDEISRRWRNIFAKVKAHKTNGHLIVIPADGIGTGLAQLETKAPNLYGILQALLKELEEL